MVVRRARIDREASAAIARRRRVEGLVLAVLRGLMERDHRTQLLERRIAAAINEMTETEGLTVSEVVHACGGCITAREVYRLRRLHRAG